jgi:hypothetical protein
MSNSGVPPKGWYKKTSSPDRMFDSVPEEPSKSPKNRVMNFVKGVVDRSNVIRRKQDPWKQPPPF